MKFLWHRLLAKLLESLLAAEAVMVLSELPATSNPPQIDILLLRRAGDQWTARQQALLPDGVRDRQMAHHLLECKITESVTEQSLQQALTYDYLYRQSQQLAADQVQTYVVSAHTPQLAKLTAWGYAISEHTGVYVSTLPVLSRVVLLVLNELSDAPHNEYFRLFASRKRVRRAALRSLAQEQSRPEVSRIWTVVLALQKAYELEGAGMNAHVTLESLLEMGEGMRKQIVASASLEERLAGLTPEEIEQLLSQVEMGEGMRKQIVASASLEERLAGLTPQEIERLLSQNEQLRKEVVSHAPPEERLTGLDAEGLRVLMKQIELYLQNQSSTASTPLTDSNQ